MEERFEIGIITATHGLKGEVKVFPTTHDASRYKIIKNVYLGTEGRYLPVVIERVKFFKQFVIVKFADYHTVEDVEKFRKCPILVDRKDAAPLEEDEYYISDMMGMGAEDEEGHPLGTLKEVISTGANDVYVLDSPELGEILVPAVKACILSVDIPGRRMKVHLMKGLIPEKECGDKSEI